MFKNSNRWCQTPENCWEEPKTSLDGDDPAVSAPAAAVNYSLNSHQHMADFVKKGEDLASLDQDS
ncbi:MAG: hypothetical protein R2861_05600 [Desulfobacterales bacterium]